MPDIRGAVAAIGTGVDAAGVGVIVLGLLWATARFAVTGLHGPGDPYRRYREGLGRSILLGLEFLVAADITRTVAVAPSLQGVLILGLIVLIRTFLSMALEVEFEGRLPWRRVCGSETAAGAGPSAGPGGGA